MKHISTTTYARKKTCRTGVWQHVAFVYDNATATQQIFVDGLEVPKSALSQL